MVQCVPGYEGVSSSEGGWIQLKYGGDVIAIGDGHKGVHDLLIRRAQTCSQSVMFWVQLVEREDHVTMETHHLGQFIDYVTEIKPLFSEAISWRFIRDMFTTLHVTWNSSKRSFAHTGTRTWRGISWSVLICGFQQNKYLVVNNEGKCCCFLVTFKETQGKLSFRFYELDLRVCYQQT